LVANQRLVDDICPVTCDYSRILCCMVHVIDNGFKNPSYSDKSFGILGISCEWLCDGLPRQGSDKRQGCKRT
jgi:hypothetical protein